MKTILTGLVSLILCFSSYAQNTYKIKGTLPDKSFDGQTVTISTNAIFMWDEQPYTNSAKIKGNKFTIKGQIADSEPILTIIKIGDKKDFGYTTFFVLEPGSIKVDVDGRYNIAIEGTQLNDELSRAVTGKQQEFMAYAETNLNNTNTIEMTNTQPELLNSFKIGTTEYIDKYVERYPKAVAGLFHFIMPTANDELRQNSTRTPDKETYEVLVARIKEPYRSNITRSK